MTSAMPLQVPNNSIPLVDTKTGRATTFFQQFLVALAAANGPSLQARVGVLEDEVVVIDATLGTLGTEVATLTTEVGTLNTEVAALTIAVTANTAQLAVLPASRLVGSSLAYTPGPILAGATVSTTVTVTGAVLGQEAAASFSHDLAGMWLFAYVSAANTVTVVFWNNTAGTLTPSSGTLKGFAWTP